MGMTPGARQQHAERERRRWEAAAPERALETEASRIVAAWNRHAGQNKPLQFYPTVGAALRAAMPICDWYCWGCGLIGTDDIRKHQAKLGDALSVLILKIRCTCAPDTRITLVRLRSENSRLEDWLNRP